MTDDRTEGNCVCMCTVHCRVIHDIMCDFLHSSCNFDTRLVSKMRKYQETNISDIRQNDLRSPTQVPYTTKKKTRSHLAECELSSANRFMSNQSSASTRPHTFRSIHPERRPTALVHEHGCDQSVLTRLLDTHCMLLFFSLFLVMVYSS